MSAASKNARCALATSLASLQARVALKVAEMTDTSLERIQINQLRVGVFVHLDLHWTQHPFQFGSFLVKNEAQLAQLRALGLSHIYYSHKRSEVVPLPVAEPGALDDAAFPGAVDDVPGGLNEEATPAGAASLPRDARRQLADQQASLERCERHFAEGSRRLRQVLQTARSNPLEACAAATEQVGSMVGQVAGVENVAIRLLSEKAGQETTLHAMNVAVLSLLLGRALGFNALQLGHLGLGAMLHDLGKAELPDRVRWRDDQAPQAERKIFREHVGHGVTIGRRMGLSREVLEVIIQHHEQADGGGYPAGLRGAAISAPSRVVSLVNQYDNLCNPANPAQACTPHDALALIFARQRDAFDAATLAAFIRMMGVYPPGSMLQLNDERYALVVSVNSDRPLKPRIVIHDASVPADDLMVFDLEEHPALGIQRAVKPLQLPRAVFDHLSPRKRMCYFFERSLEPGPGAAS